MLGALRPPLRPELKHEFTSIDFSPTGPEQLGTVLARMIGILVNDPIIEGLATAGILAAIMSSLDSQFLCHGRQEFTYSGLPAPLS